MNSIELRIEGAPVPQARARFFRRGGGVGTYDPKTSRQWKESVGFQAMAQMRESGHSLFEGPLSVSCHFHLRRPKGLPKRCIHHVKKPDVSNLVKGVEDGLKGICYRDDSQITSLVITKEYGEPGVLIGITEVGD